MGKKKKEEQQDLYKGISKCQVFANSASMQLSGVPGDWKKRHRYLSQSVKYISVFVMWLLIVHRCVQCPEKTPASPWPRVSTFSRPHWTQQETASQAKTAIRGKDEHMNEYIVFTRYSPQSRLNNFLEAWLEKLLLRRITGFCFMRFEQLLNKTD